MNVNAKRPTEILESIPHDLILDFSETYLELVTLLDSSLKSEDFEKYKSFLEKFNSTLEYYSSDLYIECVEWSEDENCCIFVMEKKK